LGFFTISNKGLQAKTYNQDIGSMNTSNIMNMSHMISYATLLTDMPNMKVSCLPSKAHRQQAAVMAYDLPSKPIVKTVTKYS
jgi:hypothetical protein